MEDFEFASPSARRPEQISSLVITHLLAERPAFLHAMARLSHVPAVLPKPRSIFALVVVEARERFMLDPLSRSRRHDWLPRRDRCRAEGRYFR